MNAAGDRLSRIDLNLLVALKVLLEVKNVTHAAERLFLTQSAMSRILKRLRELFDDPLLVRISREFALTPKAEELCVPLAQLLDRLDGFVFSKEFEPAAAEGSINIAAPPYVMGDIIIKLTDSLNREAPGLQIIAQNNLIDFIPHTGYIEMLRMGMLDFAIFYEKPGHSDFIAQPLQDVEMKFWMRRGHPLEKREAVKAVELFEYPIVVVNSPGIGTRRLQEIDQGLVKLGIVRKTTLQTSSLLIALELVYRTETLIITVNNLSEFKLIQNQLVSRPLPADMPATRLQNKFYLIQHRRTEFSPMHEWLSRKIRIFAAGEGAA